MAFKARWTGGRCVVCNGNIIKGQEITWSRKGEKKLRHIACGNSETIETAQAVEEVATQAEAHGLTESEIQNEVIQQSNLQYSAALNESITSEALASAGYTQVAGNGKSKSTVSNKEENALLDLLADAMKTRLDGQLAAKIDKALDPAELEKIISEKIEALRDSMVSRVVIENQVTNEVADAGLQHAQFPLLLKMLQAKDHKGHRLNIWITGPAGTGKTSAAEHASKALGLEFASTGALTESYKIFGFIVPGTGEYSPTPFRKIWENGGVFLFDDCDGSDPSVLVEFNNALANGGCTFPDGYVTRHPDCVLVLTANTWGLGATNDYVGRFKQDAAFLDRFVKIFWDIDEKLELATCPSTAWAKRVQAVRKRVKDKGIKVLVTPRASYYGAALLSSGLNEEETEQATLRGAMTVDQWESVK